MARVVGDIFIARAPEVVFDFVADERNEPRYNPRMSGAELVSGEPPGPGSRFRAVAQGGARPVEMLVEFTGFEPPRRLRSRTRLEGADIEGEVTFTPEGPGTRMRWDWQVRPRGALRVLGPLVGWAGARQERRTWGNLKALLEGGGGPGGPEGVPVGEERPPLALRAAAGPLLACAVRATLLAAGGRLHQPVRNVGRRVRFGDGTASAVYRETVVDRPPAAAPAVLVVGFRLRGVHTEAAHSLFRLESVLNTVFFAGFPGFVSKLWFRHDDNGTYRGLYQWDGAGLAEAYARALWWVLAVVSVPGSIHYKVLPGLRRDDLLAAPALSSLPPGVPQQWWRPAQAQPPAA